MRFHCKGKLEVFLFSSFFHLLWSRNRLDALFRSSLLQLFPWEAFLMRVLKLRREHPDNVFFSQAISTQQGICEIQTNFIQSTTEGLPLSTLPLSVYLIFNRIMTFPCSIRSISNHITRIDPERIITFLERIITFLMLPNRVKAIDKSFSNIVLPKCVWEVLVLCFSHWLYITIQLISGTKSSIT